jgi:ABC-type uncharacterized transport system auxiliary subunit
MIRIAVSHDWPLFGRPAARALVLLGLLATLAGCQFNRPQPNVTYHTFRSEMPEHRATAPAGDRSNTRNLRISRARIAPPYGSRAFQYRTGAAVFTPTYYDLWAGDPGELLADKLARQLEQQNVWSVVFDDATPALGLDTLDVRCRELYADVTDRASPSAVITIRIALLDPQGVVKMTAEFTHSEKVQSNSPAAMVEGWSRGIQAIAREIDRTLRE